MSDIDDRFADIEARANAALERSDRRWDYESRLGQVWTRHNDEDSLIHMPALRSPLGAHIAGMDPDTTLWLLNLARERGAEVERLQAVCDHSASLAESLAERLRLAWDSAEVAERERDDARAALDRVKALARRWETVPALRRGTCATDLRAAIEGA